MSRLRKKRKREVDKVAEQSKALVKKFPSLEQLANLATGYLVLIQMHKGLFFNQGVMVSLKSLTDKDERMALLIDEYLKATLSLTYNGMGAITENILEWILLDTPVSREAFSLIKDRYQQYFKK